MNNKLIPLVLSGLLLSACGTNNSSVDKNKNPSPSSTNKPAISSISTTPFVKDNNYSYVGLNTKNGQIVLKLYQKEAPNTVANFLKKVNIGFYNNLTFHRVIAGFMAQGGDPTGTGNGGGRQKSELNTIPFVRGSVGLARTADTKEYSNDSQFFICFTTDGCQHLTGDYVNFGEVVSGLDVLDKFVQGDKIVSLSTKTK